MFEAKRKQIGRESYSHMWSNLLTDHSKSLKSNRMFKINREALKDIIRGLSQLKDEGRLNDEEFSNLLTLACSAFIENELELRIENVLTNKTNRIFDRLGLNYG